MAKLKWKFRNELHGTDEKGNGVSCILPMVGPIIVAHEAKRIWFAPRRGCRFPRVEAAIGFAEQLCDYDFKEEARAEALEDMRAADRDRKWIWKLCGE